MGGELITYDRAELHKLEYSVKKPSRGCKHIKEGRRVHVCGGEYKGSNGIIAAGIGPGGLRLRAIEPGMSKVRVRLDSGELITYDRAELHKLEHSVKKLSRGSKHIKEGRRVHVCGGEYKGRNGIIAAGIGPGGLRLRAIEPGMSKVRVRLDSGELITYDKNELNKLETQDRRDKGKQKRL